MQLQGFQHYIYNKSDLLDVFTETFKSESKTIEYRQFRLRLRYAKEIDQINEISPP
jgi:hypothetical protein